MTSKASDQIRQRVESVLENPAPVSRKELDELLTDGYARALELEVETLRARRRMRAALLDAGHDDTAAREARELSARMAELEIEANELRRTLAKAVGRSTRFSR